MIAAAERCTAVERSDVLGWEICRAGLDLVCAVDAGSKEWIKQIADIAADKSTSVAIKQRCFLLMKCR
jgi:hypothetical protein